MAGTPERPSHAFSELALLGGNGGDDVLRLGGDALRDLHRGLVVALVEGVLGGRVCRQDALRLLGRVLCSVGLDLVHGSFGGLEGGFCRALLAAGDERHAAERHGGDPESVLHSNPPCLLPWWGRRILSANRPNFKWTPAFHGARFRRDFLRGADEMAQALGVLLPEPVDHDRRRASRRVDDDVREHHAGLNLHGRDLVGRDRVLGVAEETRLVARDSFGKDRDLHREELIRGRQARRAERLGVVAERPVEEEEDSGEKEERDDGDSR